MGKNVRRKLEMIEEAINCGEELFVFRILQEKLGEWRKVACNNREMIEQELSDWSGSARGGLLRKVADDLILRSEVVDLKDIKHDGLEIKAAVEIVRPKLNLLVFGGGHVGQAVALIGAILGYDVMLVDDRAEFASRRRFPDCRIRLIVGNYFDVSIGLRIKSNWAVVIVTRGHQFDEVCLRNVIRSSAGYLGMIGSKRRTLSIINRLKNNGFSDVDFSRLHAPIGLRVGARSPQEIAVAIHAEIVNHFNGNNSK